ncbi:MAG: hypothetical protein QW303_08690 [Nitrososphaerota archaeon]
MQKVISTGVLSGIVAYFVGASFGVYGIWSLIIDQSPTLIGRWLLIIVVGIALAEIYNFFGFAKSIPGDTLVNGAVFGVFIWVATLVIGAVFNVVGQYVYTSPVSQTMFLSLVLNIIWGSVIAYLFKENIK